MPGVIQEDESPLPGDASRERRIIPPPPRQPVEQEQRPRVIRQLDIAQARRPGPLTGRKLAHAARASRPALSTPPCITASKTAPIFQQSDIRCHISIHHNDIRDFTRFQSANFMTPSEDLCTGFRRGI